MDPLLSLDHILRLGQSQRIKPDAVQRGTAAILRIGHISPFPTPPPTPQQLPQGE